MMYSVVNFGLSIVEEEGEEGEEIYRSETQNTNQINGLDWIHG